MGNQEAGSTIFHAGSEFFQSVIVSQATCGLIRECPEIIEDENSVEPSLLDKQGDYPVYKLSSGEAAQAKYLCREIKALQASLAPSNMAIIDKGSTFGSDSIKLITVHSIKGIEFEVVFIIDLNDKVLPYSVISSDLYVIKW